MENKYQLLKEIIGNSKKIVFFTGAGISVPSGIPDFRSASGLYKNVYRAEEMLSHHFFDQNPEEFYEFYRDKMIYTDAKPNKAHEYIAKLEQQGKVKAVITQNIDGLHELAGSKNVIELHGSIYRNYCMQCHKFYGLDTITNSSGIPRCECGGIIKPDVVLYEECLSESAMYNAASAILAADTLIIIGTSLSVYPAANFINYYRGNNLIILNKQKTPSDYMANLVINDDIINIVNNII